MLRPNTMYLSHANVSYRGYKDYLPSGGFATNGASFNTWENNYFHHLGSAMGIAGGPEGAAGQGGEGNIFRNNVIHDVTDVISLLSSIIIPYIMLLIYLVFQMILVV